MILTYGNSFQSRIHVSSFISGGWRNTILACRPEFIVIYSWNGNSIGWFVIQLNNAPSGKLCMDLLASVNVFVRVSLLSTKREGNVFRGVCQSFCSQSASGLFDHCSSLLQCGRYVSCWNAFLLPSATVVVERLLRSCGKVMFLHLSVILFTGGSATPPPGQTLPCSACWDTVNKQVVGILWECNLVFSQVSVCPWEEMYTPCGQTHPRQTLPPWQTPLPLGRHLPPPGQTPTSGQTPLGRPPPDRHPSSPPSTPEMATAADGTHPAGMHFVVLICLWKFACVSVMNICTFVCSCMGVFFPDCIKDAQKDWCMYQLDCVHNIIICHVTLILTFIDVWQASPFHFVHLQWFTSEQSHRFSTNYYYFISTFWRAK